MKDCENFEKYEARKNCKICESQKNCNNCESLFCCYSEQEQVLFATALAMELSKGLSDSEIETLRNFLNQMSSSLASLLLCKK